MILSSLLFAISDVKKKQKGSYYSMVKFSFSTNVDHDLKFIFL